MVAELISYIKSQIAQGASREQLISHLVEYGWSEEVVRELMDDIIEPPSAAPLRKLVLPSLTIVALVVVVGFLFNSNNITGTSIYDNPVCLYSHNDITEKLTYRECCNAEISNCEEMLSAYYINERYFEFDYSCDYKRGTISLSRETVKNCGLSVA